MLNGKGIIIRLIVGLMKKMSLYKMSCFLEPYSHNERKIKVELNLFNYATKSDLKEATGINKPIFAKKVDLANLKSDVDLTKLSNVIKNYVKKTLYNELVKKVFKSLILVV